MKRWAWNIFCLLSLLVFVGSVGIWVRSYYVGDTISHSGWRTDATRRPPISWCLRTDFATSRGMIGIGRIEIQAEPTGNAPRGWTHLALEPTALDQWQSTPGDRVNLDYAGFFLVYAPDRPTQGVRFAEGAGVPLWLFLPAGIPPLLWLRAWRRSRRRRFPVAVTTDSAKENPTTREASPSLEAQRHREPRREKTI